MFATAKRVATIFALLFTMINKHRAHVAHVGNQLSGEEAIGSLVGYLL